MTSTESPANQEIQAREEHEITRLLGAARDQADCDPQAGNRTWNRFALGIKIDVTSDPTTATDRWTATMHNVSGGGFGFWSTRQMEVGATVLFREASEDNPGRWIAAVVKHCSVGVKGYLVGVAFDNPIAPDIAPEHEEALFDQTASSANAPKPHANQTRKRPKALRSLQRKAILALALLCAFAAYVAFAVGTFASEVGWAFSAGIVALWALLLGALSGALIVRREAKALGFLRNAMELLAQGKIAPSQVMEKTSKDLGTIQRSFFELSQRWHRREEEERQQRQKLEDMTRIKSNILAIVSHDLRTPLTSILLYAQMLTEEMDTLAQEDTRKFLGIITDECQRLSKLLDDLLEVQRLESGRVRWDMRTHDLASSIHASAQVFDAMAMNKSIALTVSCPATLPPVEADGGKISQVLSNLLSNAIKYTQSGGQVDVSAQPRGSEIVLCVADNGPGIPRDKWDQIFNRFSQLQDPNVSNITGFGLGLNIVKKIVEAHGGAVWCDSEVGRGTEFFVSLPTTASADVGELAEEVTSMPARRVLVCDADPGLAAAVAQALRAEQYDVRVVYSACRLLAQLNQGEIDVVVTDVLLPDMNASDLLNAIKGVRGRSFGLVIHSYAGEGRELIQRYGADVFLRRPVSKDELVSAVGTAMKKRISGGRSVLVIRSDTMDTTSLGAALADSGHMPSAVDSFEQAADMIRDYALDAVLIPAGLLDGDWSRLAKLDIAPDRDIDVVVLCDPLRRKERVLAERTGVTAVAFCDQDPEEVMGVIRGTQPSLVGEYTT